jgi:retinol dehydrogenase 12
MFESIYALFVKYPYPEVDCTGKTIIVTGANIGIGKEAVRHFVRLNASKVIIAVRSIAKGKAAQAEIEASTHHTGVTEVWELDLSSYASVKVFAARAAGLPRVDAMVANASIATEKFELAEENESTITVNVVSTILLVLLLLPTMSASALKWGIVPVITVVTSNIHSWISFPEWKTPNSLATLNDKEAAVMKYR